MENSPIFGTLLKEHRKAKGLSLWKFSVAILYRQANIQRIERGLVEPRVRLAMRLLTVLGVDVGAFMEEMAVKKDLLPTKSTQRDALVPVLNTAREKGLEPPGKLLRETRKAYQKSQNAICKAARYTTRNLIIVENGKQNPKISTVLKLVCAIG
ncbi:MAG: helix-turn-helix transcriptional regulator [Desulfovibrionaceae bacterium]|nr:helix-turn-helix transcriptional regulator [Desulfovibrionaceae bacterium]